MSDDLNFDEAEYDAPPQMPNACGSCEKTLQGTFWVEDRRFALCPDCKTIRESQSSIFRPLPLLKATLLGLIAAVVGGTGWGLISALTGYNIGLIAIFVGGAIAMGIQMGAGRGGWLFQILAAGLTYFSICFSETIYTIYTEAEGALNALLAFLVLLPVFLVGIIPMSIQSGNLFGLAIYGFAIYQAVQMTAGSAPVFEGPFSTNDG